MTHVLLGGLLAVAVMAQAQSATTSQKHQSVQSAKPEPALDLQKKDESGPFDRLFIIKQPIQSAALAKVAKPQQQAPELAKSPQLFERGGCNMPIIVGNSDVDPKIVIPFERGNTDPKIRVIQPPRCWHTGR